MEQYDQWLVDFGIRLRTERERQNLTRSALAEQINTKSDYIAQMERGMKSPSMKTLLSLMLALNISPYLLIAGPNVTRGNEMDSLLNNFSGYLKKQNPEAVSVLYEITRFLTKYISGANANA